MFRERARLHLRLEILGESSLSFFFFFLAIPQFVLLCHISSLRLSSGCSGLVLTLSMQPMTPCLVPARLWQMQASGLLLLWELYLGAYSLLFFLPPCYVALWDSNTPHRLASERVSCCLETSPPLPPQDGSPSLTFLSLFLSFIFCPTSFQREWAAFLGAWCPLPAFRSCFVEVAQHSDNLLMNL